MAKQVQGDDPPDSRKIYYMHQNAAGQKLAVMSMRIRTKRL